MVESNHNFTKSEFKAGLVVIASVVVLVIFVSTTLNLRPAAETKEFYVFLTEAALNPGADVRFGGVISGRVTDISPAPGSQSLIRVTAVVPSSLPVNEASIAYITQTSLTANQHLEITTGTDDAPLLKSGSEIPSGVGGLFGEIGAVAGGFGGLIDDLRLLLGMVDDTGEPTTTDENRKTVESLFVDLTDVLGDVQILVGVQNAEGNPAMTDEEQTTAAELLVSIDDTVDTGRGLIDELGGILDENKDEIGALMAQAGEIGASANELIDELNSLVADNKGDIEGIIGTVAETIESLSAQLDGLLASLQGALDNADALSGDARVLLEDSAPALEDIIVDLREVMRNTKEFTRTLADEPQSVIRGKTPTGRQ